MKRGLQKLLFPRTFQHCLSILRVVRTRLESYALLIAVSATPSWYVFNLLFSSPSSLPGSDPAQHIAIVRWIMNSHSILVPYSQFFLRDGNTGYYPSVWQGIIALLHCLTGISELNLMRYFIFFVFLLGTLGHYLLSKELSEGEPIKGVFLYFTLLFNIAPVIKTIRDGSYGEIVAIWFLFPFFFLFFLRRKILYSVVVLTFITAIHNLSTMMTGFLVFSFLITYCLHKEWNNVKFTLKVIALTLISSSPSLFYNYYLPLFNLMLDVQRFYFFSRFYFDLPVFLTPLTFYAGLVCLIIISLFYRPYRFLPIWFGTYLIGNYFFPNERIVRNMCVPLSLAIGIVFYDLAKNATRGMKVRLTYEGQVKKYNLPKSIKINSLILLMISLVIGYNGIGHIASTSAPVITDYFTPLKEEAYSWLNSHATDTDNTIVIRAMDSWARVYLNHYVYEIVDPVGHISLSSPDRTVNNELSNSLLDPFTLNAFSTFKKYNISHFILSAPLSGRWYYDTTAAFANMLLKIRYESIPFYKLVFYRETSNELIKIYVIFYPQSSNMLFSMPIVKDNSIILRNSAGEGIIRIPFWETKVLFSNSKKEVRLSGHPDIESLFRKYVTHSEISSDFILRTTVLFKNNSYEFAYDIAVKSSKKSVIINLTAFANLPNLDMTGIGLSCNSTNYVIFTPTGESLEYDNKTNQNIEVEGFEIMQLDDNTTVIINTGSTTIFENLFEWNVIRPVLGQDQASVNIIILSDSEAFVVEGTVYVRYNGFLKTAQEIIDEQL